jgi:CRP/FNR family transcriptional regulator, dissimilatory nitrate respiration regulator
MRETCVGSGPQTADNVSPAVWSALRSCNVLSQASDKSIAGLAGTSTVRAFGKGERILSESGTTREICIVMSGHVRAVHFGADGRPITVLVAWPCEAIGLIAALAGDDNQTAFEAAENDTSIVMFSLDVFKRVIRDEPDVMMSVVGELSRQMTSMVTMVKTLSADVPARVAIYIGLMLEDQEPTGLGPFTIDLGMTRVELAARLGTVPETLSRAFHVLQSEGVVESHGHKIVVLDRDALIARSNGVL